MNLLRIDASIRTDGSASRELADLVEREWTATRGDTTVTRRSIGVDPLPTDAWAHSVAAGQVAADDQTEDQSQALKLATELVDELRDADLIVVAAPLYNFGISQHLKVYLDLVLTHPESRGSQRLLEGTPLALVVVRGGSYGPGTPRHGWDHSTDYLVRAFADLLGADVRVIEREFTLVGVDPALDEFAEVASTMHEEAKTLATETGRELVDAAS